MSRAKYVVTTDDLFFVCDYIKEKLSRMDKGWMLRDDSIKISDYWESLSKNEPNEVTLFLEKFLNSQDFNKLKTAIRAKRKRSSGERPATVNLDRYAHSLLSERAKHESVTLSEIIKKYILPIPELSIINKDDADKVANSVVDDTINIFDYDPDRFCQAITKKGTRCKNKTEFALCDYHKRVQNDKKDNALKQIEENGFNIKDIDVAIGVKNKCVSCGKIATENYKGSSYCNFHFRLNEARESVKIMENELYG